MAERKPRVIIVGGTPFPFVLLCRARADDLSTGSLGGLFAGVSLLRLGFDVSILERSPSLQAGG